jgi:hypothetical protein
LLQQHAEKPQRALAKLPTTTTYTMNNLPLFLGVGIYFVSSLGGVSIVKFLNYHYCFTAWWILALLSRSTWVLSALLDVLLRHREGVVNPSAPSRRQIGVYCLVAAGLSLVEVANSFSMSILPGSLYMLLKGSDVGWSLVLSYFMLKRSSFSATKLAAATLVMVGIGTVLALDVIEGHGHIVHSQSSQVLVSTTGISIPMAAVLCLGGSLLNSLCTVGTEAVLKRTLQEEQDRLELLQSQPSSARPPSKLLLSNAYSMWTSFFSFGLLLSLSFFSGKGRNVNEENQYTCTNSNSTTASPDTMSVKNTESSSIVYLAIVM